MLRFFHLVFFLTFLGCLFVPQAFADIFRLKNGTQIEGNLEGFDGKSFMLKLLDGTPKTLLKDEVSLLEVSKPLPKTPVDVALIPDEKKGPFETPTQTFYSWRKAALSDDIDAMVNCYATFKQKDLRKELKKISKSKRKEMKEAAIQTRFFPNDPFYQGDRATLEVTWQKNIESDVQILQFILEGKDWKIIQ